MTNTHSSSSTAATSPPYWTTHDSNLAIFSGLSRPSTTRRALPTELILHILSHPTRWLLLHSLSSPTVRVADEERPIITLPPFSASQIPLLRRLVFRFQSRDQGFSWDRQNHGTYEGSWTWFEAVVKKGHHHHHNDEDHDHDDDDDDDDGPASLAQEVALTTVGSVSENEDEEIVLRWELQRNRHAASQLEGYEVIFEEGDRRFEELKRGVSVGDVLELRACARFGAWVNYVEEASVQVWCLDDVGNWGESR
ncbi:MAG: hypothetical protein Q9186_005480 [Xanthomendoza sp. 1 TL-2023]